MTDLLVLVLVVDDDFRVAGLHARAVAAVPGFAVAGRAGSRDAARAAVGARRASGAPPFDLALVDVYLPDGSGTGLLSELGCDAFVLSAATDPPTSRAAVRAGAQAYLVKPFPERVLQARLRSCARFRRVLDDVPEVGGRAGGGDRGVPGHRAAAPLDTGRRRTAGSGAAVRHDRPPGAALPAPGLSLRISSGPRPSTR